MSVAIHLDSLTFGYDSKHAIFLDTTVSVVPEAPVPGRGYIAVVMGASGCGKTTLLKLLLGQEKARRGCVLITPSDHRVSYLSQDPVLFEHLSVADNARYFRSLRSTRSQYDEEAFSRASFELGLEKVLVRESVKELSGGERQRIALLRAISIRPSLLLLDEPCRGLDIPARQDFLLYLRRLVDELGLAVVYVTHQPYEARLLADRVLFLVKGEKAEGVKIITGSVDELTASPPHEAIALTFADAPVSRIPAILDGDHLVIVAKPGVVRDQHAPIHNCRKGFLLVPASQVAWNAPGGIVCNRIGKTGGYVLAQLAAGTDADVVIIGDATDEKLSTFQVSGLVCFYGDSGDLIVRGKVASAGERTY